MNVLEAIALRRAEEQTSKRGKDVLHYPTWQAAPRPSLHIVKPKGGPAPSCLCGVCHKCKNRLAMRAFRASKPKPPKVRKGPRMDAGRTCECGFPISNTNRSGMCQPCHRGLRNLNPGLYRDGGGI